MVLKNIAMSPYGLRHPLAIPKHHKCFLGGQEVYRDSVSAWTLHFSFALECVWRVQGRIRRRSVWIVSLLMSLLSWLRSCVWPFMGAPVCQTYAPPVNRSAPRTIMDALNIIHATLLHNMWCTHHYMCHTCIINDEPTVNIARNRKEKLGQLSILDLPAILYSDGAKTTSFGP